MTYLLLFLEFFKTGVFNVGGGLAALPFLYDIGARYPHWFTTEELVNMIAISQSTPGPIGINMATYVGYNVGGVLGSVAATFSIILPALVFMPFIAKGLEAFSENKLVKGAFYGLRPAVVALIASAAFDVMRVSLFTLSPVFSVDFKALPLFLVSLALMQSKKIKWHPAVFLLAGAVLGILFKF